MKIGSVRRLRRTCSEAFSLDIDGAKVVHPRTMLDPPPRYEFSGPWGVGVNDPTRSPQRKGRRTNKQASRQRLLVLRLRVPVRGRSSLLVCEVKVVCLCVC